MAKQPLKAPKTMAPPAASGSAQDHAAPAKRPAASVEVVATATGFYDGARRRAGQTFLVRPGDKAKWFARTDGKPNDLEPVAAAAAADFERVEDLKEHPEENDLLNGREEKIGEKADGLEDKARAEGLGQA